MEATHPRLLGIYGAWLTIIGVVVSGPLALVLVNALHPQPPWRDPDTFVRHFHPMQTLPFFGGFFLIGGFVLLIASLHTMAKETQRASTAAALVLVSVYAAMVFTNYVIQTTFVPALAQSYTAADGPLLAAFTMANPRSLAWGLEMWGYGFLGVATWICAAVFGDGPVERVAACTFVANGPLSIVPAVFAALSPGWMMTPFGLAAFVGWNVLALAMGVFALVAFRHRAQLKDEHPVVRPA
jgi:hypothetical protein